MHAPMVYRHHVGVARIFEMPSGCRRRAAIRVMTAKISEGIAFCRKVANFGSRKKIVVSVMPANAIDAIDPLTMGNSYQGGSKWIQCAVLTMQNAVIAKNHAAGAQSQRRVVR